MAQSTVLAVGAALIVNGLLVYAGQPAALSWIVAGVVAIAVGWGTKNMK
jgi:branched-subunit amino acid transport protein